MTLNIMSKRLYLIIYICCSVLAGYAQSAEERYRAIYDAAEQDYSIGRLDEARQSLMSNLDHFPASMRQSVYRILSLCELALDDTEAAERYVRLLLDDNPYYSTTISDPQRFIDMVENIKAGRTATITTASSQAESLSEVPVPTTLITQEMIQNCGARNLQEVLAAYVPGMNIVDCNDDINIAMRGIYSNGQEKILIMLNGHRLNSFATNIAAPDFSISLDKINKIEVLRGPASSLYGGVSLTAVVNVITRQGAEVNGIEARLGAGSYGQFKASMLFGKRYFDLDMLIWGNLYKAKGESVFVSADETGLKKEGGDVTVGGIGPKPSYDFGIQMKYKGLQFLYTTMFSQVISPFTMTYSFSPYTYDRYRTFNGVGPGFTSNAHHVDLSYRLSTNDSKFSTQAAITYDNSDLTQYQVVTEPVAYAATCVLPLPNAVMDPLQAFGGIYRYLNAQEYTIGGKLQTDWSYIDNGTHRGLFTLGAEYSYFKTEDARYVLGYEFNQMLTEGENISQIGKGHESNMNGFAQLKHQWKSFIINAGMRFDYKNRFNETKIREFSPRLALIYIQPKWNLKLSYSKSFIDAPFMYRKMNYYLSNYLNMTTYGDDLEPESLHSYQLTFGATQWIPGLNFEVNGFYNRASDLIYYVLVAHGNIGTTDNYGVELSASYERRRFSANLITTWQAAVRNDMLGISMDNSLNIPKISADAVFAWQATDRLKLRTHIDFKSKQHAFYYGITEYAGYLSALNIWLATKQELEDYTSVPDYDPAVAQQLMEEMDAVQEEAEANIDNIQIFKDVAARVLFDVGATWKWQNFTLDLDVKNLFNHRYTQSGMSTGLIPQRGRWFMATIGYKF